MLALLRGDFVASFLYHPLVAYCAVIFGLAALSWVKLAMTGGESRKMGWSMRYVYVGIGLTALNFLLKNALLLFWQIDLMKILDGAA